MATADVVLRLVAAVLIGGVIGLNRDLRGKPAGVRTHALVCLGAAVAIILAVRAGAAPGADPAGVTRVVQGIITGIGFLGAGVILHPEGRSVRGLTTAASIWVVAALGIGCGVGDWVPVVVGTGLMLVVLISGGLVERLMHRAFGGGADPGDDA